MSECRFIIEGEWSGYQSSQQRVVHRTVHKGNWKKLRAEMISGRRELLTHFTGLFNGPITPDSYQQAQEGGVGE